MRRRVEVTTRKWKRDVRRRFAEWEGVFGPVPESAYFEDSGSVVPFSFEPDRFDPAVAWWLAELCRTAYTPDRKELPRARSAKLPHRENFLGERTPFVEVQSFHKTGNHASLYRLADGSGGTVLCFRGSQKTRQWVMNLVIRPHGWRRFRLADEPEDAFVHSGFYVFFKRIWPRIEPVLETMPRPWIFTGHSLGGALAHIGATLAEPDLLCTFGAPKLGNGVYHELRRASRTWRVVNGADVVPRLPLPDERLRDRTLVHATEAILLTGEGQVGAPEAGEEDRLPFSLRKFGEEFRSPPSWLRDHRIGEYCRKLRMAAACSG